MAKKEFITLKEMAEILGVCYRTAKKIIQNNDIHYTRTRRKILVNKECLINYINSTNVIRY